MKSLDVQVITSARVGVINFVYTHDKLKQECDIVVNNVLAVHNSNLIRSYWKIDKTNKVRAFLLLVKKFAKNFSLSQAYEGYLSSYAWVVLGLHFLLRFGYVPCLQVRLST